MYQHKKNTERYEAIRAAKIEAEQIEIASIAPSLGVELIKTGNRQYREANNKSMTIYDGNRFKDHGTGAHGRTIDYVMHHMGYSFNDAVAWLVPHLMPGDYNFATSAPKVYKKVEKAPEKSQEEIMAEQLRKYREKSKDDKLSSSIQTAINFLKKESGIGKDIDAITAITDYLTVTRGIDKDIVKWMIDNGLIKDDARYNVCFVWRDEQGQEVGMDKRGIFIVKDKDKGPFRGIQSYSLKQYGFNLRKGEAKRLMFFEAAIDLLSYLTLYKGQTHLNDTIYIAMAGLTDICVNHWTKKYPDAEVVFAVDDDAAGTAFAEKFAHKSKGYTRLKPNGAKDWNEMLINLTHQHQAYRMNNMHG